MATNAELEQRLREVEKKERELRIAVVTLARALNDGGHLASAQVAVVQKVLG